LDFARFVASVVSSYALRSRRLRPDVAAYSDTQYYSTLLASRVVQSAALALNLRTLVGNITVLHI
jgi:hypothetical protein